MTTTINIELDEVCRVFDFLEKVQDLMHQPEKYEDIDIVKKFVEENYSEVKELYYDVVWNWLPNKKKQEIEER
jgi:hypothetical protein